MELRAGYKQTAVGVIPEEWEVNQLDTLGSRGRPAIKAGPFGSSLTKDTYVLSGYKVYGQEQVIRDDYLYGDYFISTSKFNELRSCAVVPGDVLLSLVGTAGRILVMPDDAPQGIINPRLIRFSFDPERVCPHFFRALFETDAYQGYLFRHSQGGTMGVLNAGVLRPVRIPLPPIAEQRVITGVLRGVDALLGALEKLIAKKRDLKQAAMQQLLTGQTRVPGFSGEWDLKRFGEIALPRRERVDPRRTDVHDFCVELEHVEQGTGRLAGNTVTDTQSSLKSMFRTDDVLFGKLRAYLRKYWLADRDGVCSTEIWAFVANRRFAAPGFLFQMVKSDRFIEMASTAYGTHMPRSDWNVVKNYEVMLPSTAEQTAIATVLSDMDAEITAIEERLAKTRALKQGMMQELLTGRTRLV